MATSALERIKAIKQKADEEIEKIKGEVVSEIAKRRSALKEELDALDKEYAELTGKTVRGERVRRVAGVAATAKSPKADVGDDKELAEILKKAEGHKLNRKGFMDAGYNLKSALLIAKADRKRFGFSQNGPQGEVWLK
jgi:hypothetical protein